MFIGLLKKNSLAPGGKAMNRCPGSSPLVPGPVFTLCTPENDKQLSGTYPRSSNQAGGVFDESFEVMQ